MRRQFLDELKAQIPIHPVTEFTAEIVGRIGGEQAAKGISLPLADLIIGACAVELGYAIGTINVRDFNRIPGLRRAPAASVKTGWARVRLVALFLAGPATPPARCTPDNARDHGNGGQ